MLNVSQNIDQQELRLNKKANESVSELTQTAWTRSTDLDVAVALLNRDAKKVDNLKRIAQELQQNTESIKKALQKYGQRAIGEEVKEDDEVEPTVADNESPAGKIYLL